jgi:hypothetical protein
VWLKNLYPFINWLTLSRDAYLEFSGASVVGAIDLGLFIVCCISDSVAYKVVAYLDDAHLVSK